MKYESTFNAIDKILRNEAGSSFFDYYARGGYKELAEDNFSKLIGMRFNSHQDAIQILNLNIS